MTSAPAFIRSATVRPSGLATAVGTEADTREPRIDAATARAVRAASRHDAPDADLATLVRSASEPGLKARIQAYRQRVLASRS